VKKLINNVENVVTESLAGFAAAHADLVRLHPSVKAVLRADAPKNKVALLSGGGSGHEPLHGGYVGYGMLDAACPGEIFTSPTPDQMYEAAKAVHGGKGVLFIVKNYTGDVMNFQMAADMLAAEGIDVAQVVIDDDVAVKDSLYTAGRRGVGGTVLAEKIAGALAELGGSLDEVRDVCALVNAQVRSMGMALTSCAVPAAGKPTFDLPEDAMEIGIGIHGEPGRERMSLRSAAEIVDMMATAVVDDLPFAPGDEVGVLLNGMGGTPLLELYLLFHDISRFLGTRGLRVGRQLVGNYITSLEMQGFSLTLLKLDSRLKALWDYPVHTPALRWGR